jgi:hypothetical protein
VHTCWCICVLYCLVLTKDQNKFRLSFQNAFRSIFLLWYIYISFFYNQIPCFSSANQPLQTSREFFGLFCSLFLLTCEHNLIFRCSKISYHELQILYLDSTCSLISSRIFPEFLEPTEYFSWLIYQF